MPLLVASRIPKQDLALEFCRDQNKDSSILIETHINHNQIHHVKNNWFGPIFFCSGDTHTKVLLVQLHPGLEGVTEVDTDPKRRFALLTILTLMIEFWLLMP